ncbi:hypothetical protein [Burkholderia sp. BCC0419]|nr:hypothetical protein [Burkholderia sp. BCC0419]
MKKEGASFRDLPVEVRNDRAFAEKVECRANAASKNASGNGTAASKK